METGENTIRVLKAGKGTLTRLRYEGGLPEDTLLRVGAGRYLPGEFLQLPDAKAFGESELRGDPAAILYIVCGDQILDTLMDREYQARKSKRYGLVYAVVSSTAVLAISLCVSIFIVQFNSTLAHALFTGGMTLLYAALLFVSGTRNFHALLMFFLIIVMMTFLAPAVRELVNPAAPKVSGPRR